MATALDKIEASKAKAREENVSALPHSNMTARNDAAWSAVTSGEGGGGTNRGSQKSLGKNLRSELDEQQMRSFTRWWNSWLSEVNLKVNDLCEDIKPGIMPIKLLEVLSDSSCGKVSPPPLSPCERGATFYLRKMPSACTAALRL